MTVNVLFFGIARDLTGVAQERWQIAEGKCVGDLWDDCETRFPRLAELAASLVTAVNQEIAECGRELRDGDEVAFLPPVSGGAPENLCQLTRETIPTGELAQRMKAPPDGAVVIFEGIVRDHSQGRRTLYLEYEAYEPMALRKMKEIQHEVELKYAIDRVGLVHRLGRIEIGETSVAIIVTSSHRRAAFEACHFAIDRLKQIVPIWKKEYFEDGAVWAEGEGEKQKLETGNQKAESRNQKGE